MASVARPYIKEERDDPSFAGVSPHTLVASHAMAQQAFPQFGGINGHGSTMDPNTAQNDFSMGGGLPSGYSAGGFNSNSHLYDSELLDGLQEDLHSPSEQIGNQGQNFGSMGNVNMGFPQGNSVHLDNHVNGYSNTPDGDPLQSPFMHSFPNQPQMRQMHQNFGAAIQSPMPYSGSPLAQSMQRKASNARSPLTAKANPMMGIQESGGFGAQPIRTTGIQQDKSPSQQWDQTPNSLGSFPGSGFPSPMQSGLHHNVQITDMLMSKAGTSMPAKLGQTALSSQDIKRKRRRESHNLVERRRRDNINERIQDLSKLVPTHRLEDEKLRKLIQNGTPLSPTLTGIGTPSSGSGPRRPGGGPGNITTGLPVEEKDKGPNKGDILNGAVSWTRDLMWMLRLKLQQMEELVQVFEEKGLDFPFEFTEDERRMQTELNEALGKSDVTSWRYSRFAGSGLRVPHHTDYKGEALDGSVVPTRTDGTSTSPDDNSAIADEADNYWQHPDDVTFKEEDEYMDLN